MATPGLACGSSPPPQQTCSFSNAPPAPAPGAVNSAQDFATASELAKYDSLFGRYLRGDVTVYRGTLSAQATDAVNDSAPVYQVQSSIPEGAALAMLDIRSTWEGDWFPPRSNVPAGSVTAVLLVHSLPSRLYVDYGQVTEDPGVTWAGTITSDDPAQGVTDNGFVNSCAGCAPGLWDRPSAIAFDGLVTNGTASVFNSGVYTDVPISTTGSVHLTAAAPCDLGWQDLTVLNTAIGPNEFAADLALQGFQPEGELMVSHDGGLYLPVSPAHGQCVPGTSYSVDLWVDPSDLSSHGVRNFTVVSTSNVCGV